MNEIITIIGELVIEENDNVMIDGWDLGGLIRGQQGAGRLNQGRAKVVITLYDVVDIRNVNSA